MKSDTFGPYQLQGLVGRGGMGEVHRAYDTRRERTVALKRLRPELATDDRFRRRFLKECQRAAQLTEPHVIPIHDFGEVDGRLYLDMRLVEGSSLAHVLAGEEPLPPTQAVEVVAQIAAALDAAHAAHLVHRDVKPSNVLLDSRGSTLHSYLVDFGIAGAGGDSTSGLSLTATGGLMGTLDYLAPERLRGRPADHRVDVYSLACLLHEALTGQPPFRQPEMWAMVNAHLNLEPPRASELVASVPTGLDAVVARGMAKEPSERYASAGELAAAAQAALQADLDPAPVDDAADAVPDADRPREVEPIRVAAVAPVAGPVPVPVPAPDGEAVPEQAAAARAAALTEPVPNPDDQRVATVVDEPPADRVTTAEAAAPTGPVVPDAPADGAVTPAEAVDRDAVAGPAEAAERHTPAAARVAPPPPPRRAAPTRPPRPRWAPRMLVSTLVLVALGAAGATSWLLTPQVHLESATTAGARPPFIPSNIGAAGGTGTPAEPRPSAPAVVNLAVTGDTPGLYGGTRGDTCDKQAIGTYLKAEPDKAAAWTAALGLRPDQIESFLESLTPVTLRTDTAVTNHGFEDGLPTPFQSVIQAGTAVLVDAEGLPRVRCYCGNPLAEPSEQTWGRYVGADWDGFSGSSVTVISKSRVEIREFVLVDLDTKEVVSRPRGTGGAEDRQADPDVKKKVTGGTSVDDSFASETSSPTAPSEPTGTDAAATPAPPAGTPPFPGSTPGSGSDPLGDGGPSSKPNPDSDPDTAPTPDGPDPDPTPAVDPPLVDPPVPTEEPPPGDPTPVDQPGADDGFGSGGETGTVT